MVSSKSIVSFGTVLWGCLLRVTNSSINPYSRLFLTTLATFRITIIGDVEYPTFARRAFQLTSKCTVGSNTKLTPEVRPIIIY